MAGAVARKGELLWSGAAGGGEPLKKGREATPDTQYRIGSITKTFTAVALMQLRDEGRARPRRPARAAPRRRRERHAHDQADARAPAPGSSARSGEMWVTGVSPTAAELVEGMRDAESSAARRVAPLLNLAYALLGEVVARRRGKPYTRRRRGADLRAARDGRTTWSPQGLLRAGISRRRARRDGGGASGMTISAASRPRANSGRRWEDLCRWARARRGPTACSTRRPSRRCGSRRSMYHPDKLGARAGPRPDALQSRRPDLGRPGGAMAGHLAGVYVERKSGIAAAALTNSAPAERWTTSPRRSGKGQSSCGPRRSSRGGPRRSLLRRCARCSGSGGRRATSSSSGGSAAS